MGPREFSFDTGGPAILGADPDDGSWYIEEEQTFVLVFDAPVDLASFEEKVFCESEALEERIPMSALTGERAEAVLDHWLTDDQNYLWIAHPADAWSRTASDDPAHLTHIRERLVVAQCQRALPPSKRAYIVIGEGLETPDGLLSQAERTLGFRVRDEFLPSFHCKCTV